MLNNRTDIINAVAGILSGYSEPELCILYGSAAADRLTPFSDVDLAVGSSKGLDNSFCLDLSLKISLATGREASVLNIEKLEGVILTEVLSKGEILKKSNPGYLSRFIIKMYEFNEDILPYQMMGIQAKIDRYLNG